MKRLIFFLFLTSLTPALHAQDGSFGSTPSFEADDSVSWIDDSADEMPVRSFGQFDCDYESIYDSQFKNPEYSKQQIGFGEGNLNLSYTHLFSKDHGLNAGVGCTRTSILWDDNPFFNQQNFDALNLSINGFTKLFRCLEIKGGGSISIDLERWDWSANYYNLTAWGRYIWCSSYCGEVGFNFGATSRLGLERGFLYPIFGVDLEPWENLKVNLIFPIDMAVIYKVSKCWSFDIRGKLWNSRRQLGEKEFLSNGYFEYINSGIEAGVSFECDPYAFANFHVGTTLGNGEFRVSDSNDLNATELTFQAAPYIGIELWARF